jgi:large subunit ribosomal protein LP2
MRHLAAYLLLVAGGNAAPSAADVKNLLSKSNVAVDDERLAQLISELAGKDIDEIIAAGKEQLIPIVSGGGGAVAAAAGAAPAAEAAAPVKVKEEEVDPMEGGMSMFGGGDGGDY